MLLFFAVLFFVAPETAMTGSSVAPARTLALMFASRTFVVGLALVLLALRGKREGLAWVLFADAAFQLFDAGMAVASDKGALAVLPLVIGGIDAWVGITQLRVGRAIARSREAQTSTVLTQ
jgi:hypothetical protein